MFLPESIATIFFSNLMPLRHDPVRTPANGQPLEGTSSGRLRDQHGFVLVAVLLLIALATVLIVTTSSVSQIERKAVSNSAKQEIARQNALFALGVAMAQLQSAAGPDQRVTATADILNSNSLSPSPVKNPFWTGVWKTANPAWLSDSARSPWYRPQPLDVKMVGQSTDSLRTWSTQKSNITWLVSSPAGTTIDPLTWVSSSSNSIIMAANWGTNRSVVYAPLVTTTNSYNLGSNVRTNVGGYAYWISDEGVKAKVTLTDTNMSANSPSTQGMLVSALLHFTAPSAHNIAAVMGDFGISGVSDLRANKSLTKLTSLNGLSFLGSNIPAITNNIMAADLTVNGYGVLCDVRRGGLRQDLTAALESSTANPSAFRALQLRSGLQDGSIISNDSLMAYRVSSAGLPQNISSYINGGTGSILDGLRWQSVYNFYNFYKTQWPQSPLVTGASGTAPSGVGPPSLSAANKVTARDPFFTDPAGTKINSGMLTPNIIADSVIVTLDAVPLSVTSGSPPVTTTNYFFRVTYTPLLTLHNPYSVALDIGNTSFNVTKNLASALAVKLTCTTNGMLATPTFNPNPNDPNNLWPTYISGSTNTNTVFQGGTYPFSLTATNPAGTIMAPGETRVYGRPGVNASYIKNTITNNCTFTPQYMGSLIATNVFSVDQGFGGVSVTLTNWAGSRNASDIISLSYVTLPTVNYNTYHFSPAGVFNSGSYPFTVSTWPGTATTTSDLPGYLGGTSLGSYTANNKTTTFAALTNNPITVLSVTERLKGIIPGTTYLSFSGRTTNYPLFMGNSIYYNADRSGAGLGGTYCPATETDIFITNAPSLQVVPNTLSPKSCTVSWLYQPVGDAAPNTSTGPSNNAALVIRDVPISPLVSLGQLMHLEEYYNQGSLNGTYNLFPVCVPGMSIGGSFCCPETGPAVNAIYYNGNSGANTQWHLLADHSFLANEALFDTYFFSTVPPSGGFSWGASLTGNNPFSASITSNSIASGQSLPNNRYVYYRKNGTNPAVADLQDEGKAAANLMVDGAFNVNSTSVTAWKALLTSLNGQSFKFYNYVSGLSESRDVTNPILRFWDVARGNVNTPWDGMRSLTDSQVTALANEIVKQVRSRGPFLSMGDFLNRRLSTVGGGYSKINLMGALQAAIENTQTNGTSADVNDIIHLNSSCSAPTSSLTYTNTGNPAYPANGYNSQIPLNTIVTNSATGIPGYLMQQDLVQAFAPVLTARSDTFVIRIYGQAITKTGGSSNSDSQAWGEAVVQRLPEYLDQTDAALSKSCITGLPSLGDATPVNGPIGVLVNQVNQSFGRRFKLVSLRWLNQNEL